MNLFPRLCVIFPAWSERKELLWWHWCSYSRGVTPSHCLPPLLCLLLLREGTALLLRQPKPCVWELRACSKTGFVAAVWAWATRAWGTESPMWWHLNLSSQFISLRWIWEESPVRPATAAACLSLNTTLQWGRGESAVWAPPTCKGCADRVLLKKALPNWVRQPVWKSLHRRFKGFGSSLTFLDLSALLCQYQNSSFCKQQG